MHIVLINPVFGFKYKSIHHPLPKHDMNYKIVENLTESQISQLVELYSKEFWSKKRQLQDVIKMVAGSDVIIALVDESDNLIAFTRILTDFVYRATVYDVIVKDTHRYLGIGTKLMDAIVNHPRLASVEMIALYCLPEMIPFYQRWGFKADLGEMRLMCRVK
jgi:GNAT superfamily N-acetyltransferase